jgi:hypothetical protein
MTWDYFWEDMASSVTLEDYQLCSDDAPLFEWSRELGFSRRSAWVSD